VYGSKGWLVLGRKSVSGKNPRIEAMAGYDFSLLPSPASTTRVFRFVGRSALRVGGTGAINWHMTRRHLAWSATEGFARPATSGSRGGANLLGPQTRSLLIVIVKRFAARSLASVALLDMLGPMLAHAGVRGGCNHRADFAHSVASLASRGHDLSPNIR